MRISDGKIKNCGTSEIEKAYTPILLRFSAILQVVTLKLAFELQQAARKDLYLFPWGHYLAISWSETVADKALPQEQVAKSLDEPPPEFPHSVAISPITRDNSYNDVQHPSSSFRNKEDILSRRRSKRYMPNN